MRETMESESVIGVVSEVMAIEGGGRVLKVTTPASLVPVAPMVLLCEDPLLCPVLDAATDKSVTLSVQWRDGDLYGRIVALNN